MAKFSEMPALGSSVRCVWCSVEATFRHLLPCLGHQSSGEPRGCTGRGASARIHRCESRRDPAPGGARKRRAGPAIASFAASCDGTVHARGSQVSSSPVAKSKLGELTLAARPHNYADSFARIRRGSSASLFQISLPHAAAVIVQNSLAGFRPNHLLEGLVHDRPLGFKLRQAAGSSSNSSSMLIVVRLIVPE